MEDIQKEMRVRSRILGIYNKRREDYPSKEEWDDYLENVEDIIFNLANRIDERATEAKVVEYERANRLTIIANQARVAEEHKKAQESTAAAAAAASGNEPGPAAVPYTFKPQMLIAAQPLPVNAPAVDSEGRLVVVPVSRAQFGPMAGASGWTSDLPRARALQEAFSSVLIF